MARNEIPKLIARIKVVSETVSYTAPARASEKVTDSLQQLGPRWTGLFSNSWFIQSKDYGLIGDGTGQPGNPRPIRIAGSPPRSKVKQVIASGSSTFSIVNDIYYSQEAIDAVPYTPEPFDQPDPLKDFKVGVRNPGDKRGMKPSNLNAQGNNRQTADLDWFPKYAAGGKMQKDVETTFASIFNKLR